MTPFSRQCKGISLVELVVVLAIVGTLAFAGSWSFNPKPSTAVKGMTEQVVAALAEGRQWARTTGGRVVLHVRGTTRSDFTLTFEVQDPIAGTTAGPTFAVPALDSAVRAHAAVGLAGEHLTQVAPDLTDLKKVSLVQDWAGLLTADHALFTGRESTAYAFDAAGAISQDCYLTISGIGPGPGSPLGLVVLTRAGGLHAFLKSSAQAPWRTL